MPNLQQAIAAYAASCPNLERGAPFSRLEYWLQALGHRDVTILTPEDVDEALVKLAERGRLKPKRGQNAQAVGEPFKGSTVNRYLSTPGTVYKHARRLLTASTISASHYRQPKRLVMRSCGQGTLYITDGYDACGLTCRTIPQKEDQLPYSRRIDGNVEYHARHVGR